VEGCRRRRRYRSREVSPLLRGASAGGFDLFLTPLFPRQGSLASRLDRSYIHIYITTHFVRIVAGQPAAPGDATPPLQSGTLPLQVRERLSLIHSLFWLFTEIDARIVRWLFGVSPGIRPGTGHAGTDLRKPAQDGTLLNIPRWDGGRLAPPSPRRREGNPRLARPGGAQTCRPGCRRARTTELILYYFLTPLRFFCACLSQGHLIIN